MFSIRTTSYSSVVLRATSGFAPFILIITSEVGSMISPLAQMRKLRVPEINYVLKIIALVGVRNQEYTLFTD